MNPAILLLPWGLVAQSAEPGAGDRTGPPPATQPAAAEPEPTDEELEKQFEDTLAADRAQTADGQRPSPFPSAAILNPAMSVFATFSFAWSRAEHAPTFLAHDDAPGAGFAVQELELALSADVDPYFKMRTFFAIVNGELEIEEAYLFTTSLPWNLQVKAGSFRSAFGRNNEQHLHMQEFGRRPKTTLLLGEDGLRGPGAQLNVLLPLPWYASVFVEAFSLPGTHEVEQLSAVAGVEQFFELSDAWSLMVGVTGARRVGGEAHAHGDEPPDPMMPPEEPEPEYLVGADVYLKWRPSHVSRTYRWVAATAEVVLRRPHDGDAWDGAVYGQLVAQVARRFRAGVRVDLLGVPEASEEVPRELVGQVAITFAPTEYSRVRLTYQHEHRLDGGPHRNDVVILQLEGAIGAHPAHPF